MFGMLATLRFFVTTINAKASRCALPTILKALAIAFLALRLLTNAPNILLFGFF